MKILLICNDSNTIINFRKDLILFLKSKSVDVFVIAGDDKRKKDIDKLGVSFYPLHFSNRSINPFKTIRLKKEIKRIISLIKPSIVFTFQIKPNIFGTLAAKECEIKKIYSMVEGLGDPFQGNSISQKIIRFIVCKLYKKAFKYSKTIFFLNNDDKNEFVTRKIISEDKTILIPSIGINVKEYNYIPIFNYNKVVMFARLIKNKGIFDFCMVAKKVSETRRDIKFELYGEESQITKDDLKYYISNGYINYLGVTNNVNKIMSDSTIIVSTSFREGFSKIILEAMACGRPVIAYNVVGNKDSVIDGKTGCLINKNDIDGFANKIIQIIDNKEMLNAMGNCAREICRKKYDSNIVNSMIFDIIIKNG